MRVHYFDEIFKYFLQTVNDEEKISKEARGDARA